MQDAAVFEKTSQSQKNLSSISSQGFTIQANRSIFSKANEQTDNSDTKQLNGSNDQCDDVKRSTNVHMVPTDGAIGNAVSGASVPIHVSHSQLMWSVPNVSDHSSEEGLNSHSQGISSLNNNNGSVTFQQFPTNINAAVNTSTVGVGFPSPSNQSVSSILSQQGKRAITGHNNVINFPRQQGNILVNSCNSPKVMPNWSGAHQTAWPTQHPHHQTQTALYPPWSVQQQRRSVPNMNSLAPVTAKKQAIQQQLQQIPYASSNSKFRRSTSYPNQMQQVNTGPKNPYEFPTFDEMTFQVR